LLAVAIVGDTGFLYDHVPLVCAGLSHEGSTGRFDLNLLTGVYGGQGRTTHYLAASEETIPEEEAQTRGGSVREVITAFLDDTECLAEARRRNHIPIFH